MNKIAIGISSGDNIKAKTVATIFSLVKKHPEIDLIIKQSCLVHKNRNDIVEEALKDNYTHIFFVDTDMCFSPQVLERLLIRDKDIIGANYYKRNLNKETVIKFMEDGKLVGKQIPEDLFECASIGTGCALIKTDVFKKIGFPYFDFKDEMQKEEVGEDVFFCLKAIRNGYKVWVDNTVDVGHIGEYVY
tara:strand:+ start:994 stop:1560 length:567 start_codon:yes stop_codon:yes gene_type:complete